MRRMRLIDQASVCCCAPFAVWILLQMLLPATAETYALRAAAAAAAGVWALAAMRRRISLRGFAAPGPAAAGIAAGLLVAVLWIFPEYCEWYRRWCVFPLGRIAAPPSASPYDPATCGWTLTLAKLAGSAFVIAPAEEIFFRLFLYRRLQADDFLSVPPARFDLQAFAWTVALFTLEHDRPLAAAMAGAAYGLLALRCGVAGAIVAHVTTNFALGVHVIVRGEWHFW